MTALVTCILFAVMTLCHLPTSARYSRSSKGLSGDTKRSTLHSFNLQLPGGGLHQGMLLQATNDPARCQEALHLPACWCQCPVFFALLLSFAAMPKTRNTVSYNTRDRLNYLLQSAVLTQRQSLTSLPWMTRSPWRQRTQ